MAQAQIFLPDLLPADDAVTPLMAQYLALKTQHKDCLLFFRLGDFYELFFEDAVRASQALDIALTRRGQHQGQDVPMCGVPAHSYEGHLAKLIRKGFRVALCEQTEDPTAARKRGAKSIVTREVVRIVTPGTVTEDSLLDTRTSNHLCCLAMSGGSMALSWLDIVAAQPYTQSVNPLELSGALARIDPAEILLTDHLNQHPDFYDVLLPWREKITTQPASRFDGENAKRRILGLYKVAELTPFGDFTFAEVVALGALLDYAVLTQKSDLKHLTRPQQIKTAQVVTIDSATRRNLELMRTLSGERQGSLLASIDRTCTGAGARLLASRLSAPLLDVSSIKNRLDAVEFLVTTPALSSQIRELLKKAPDLERALARVALNRGGPRDLAHIGHSLQMTAMLRVLLRGMNERVPAELESVAEALGEHSGLVNTLKKALAEELPLLARDGNFIARGYSETLDEMLVLRDDSRRFMMELQQRYVQESGVPTLKIRHNMVLGYYIEVTPAHAEKLLVNKDIFIHRQSLASAVRFTTVELSELERKITEAADKALALELQIFSELVKDVMSCLVDLRRAAESLAMLDVASSLAFLACEQRYTRPEIDDSRVFVIKGGRHPVVEQAQIAHGESTAFVANNCDLAVEKRLWLLTGPNMAGKSTFLRQNALIALLAQMGSFVPASYAHLGVIDRLFSRVGAADDLARGRSTFMVEMVETAAILNQAGEKALVILDEIGRGTSTFDGLSIAWATLEHLHSVNRCRALFATHYHELTSLAERLPALSCFTMRIREWEDSIIFLHEVVPGVADRSYGIHVARMAGLPAAVIARAEEVLSRLEAGGEQGRKTRNLTESLSSFHAVAEKTKDKPITRELENLLRSLHPDEMSPKEALEAIYRISASLRGTRKI